MSYGGGAKCPKCQKTVYFNEEVLAAGKKWHKTCFRCFQCSKSLDSMTMANRGGELYCQACHKKNFANFEMVKEVQPGEWEQWGLLAPYGLLGNWCTGWHGLELKHSVVA